MRHISASVRRVIPLAVGVITFAAGAAVRSESFRSEEKNPKPSIRLKASPIVSFAPSRVVLTVDVNGGANDYEEFYCASVEWDFGDGTKAEAKADCDPYEPGKSEIKRRYTYERIFRTRGDYNIEFRLKQKNKVVGMARTSIKVRPGLSDGIGDDRY